jgi:hypothetical protein
MNIHASTFFEKVDGAGHSTQSLGSARVPACSFLAVNNTRSAYLDGDEAWGSYPRLVHAKIGTMATNSSSSGPLLLLGLMAQPLIRSPRKSDRACRRSGRWGRHPPQTSIDTVGATRFGVVCLWMCPPFLLRSIVAPPRLAHLRLSASTDKCHRCAGWVVSGDGSEHHTPIADRSRSRELPSADGLSLR